jgi:hypothetical protein
MCFLSNALDVSVILDGQFASLGMISISTDSDYIFIEKSNKAANKN